MDYKPLIQLGKFIGGGLAIGIGVCGAAIALAILGSKTLEAIARQPSSKKEIRAAQTPTFILIIIFAVFAIGLGALILFL